MPPVKAAPFDPTQTASRLQDLGAARGFCIETFGERDGCPLFALTRRARGVAPRIYLSAGQHGDEPAAPLAVLELLARGTLDDRATFFLCPLLNPSGLARGTRDNADGIDLNRDYLHLRSPEIRAHVAWLRRQPNFDLTLCLHEDWESAGFYLYELNPENRPSLAQRMLDAVAAGCPIDSNATIDGREACGGIIRPISDPLLRQNWPEAIYLRAHHTRLSYTLESPSAFPLEQRVHALVVAVEAALAAIAPAKSLRRRGVHPSS